MRTFITLDLPEYVKEELAEIILNLRSRFKGEIKWTSKENLHITLLFIGKTDAKEVEEIKQVAEDIFSNSEESDFEFSDIEIIPRVNPRIIWVRVKPRDKQIFILYKRLYEVLSNKGFILDKREVNFHITIGRIKKRLPNNWDQYFLTTELKKRCFKISGATYFQSKLSPSEPEYYALQKYEFKEKKIKKGV